MSKCESLPAPIANVIRSKCDVERKGFLRLSFSSYILLIAVASSTKGCIELETETLNFVQLPTRKRHPSPAFQINSLVMFWFWSGSVSSKKKIFKGACWPEAEVRGSIWTLSLHSKIVGIIQRFERLGFKFLLGEVIP
ncbi:hypothetical protein PNOK_0496100 [Pyrrhoderma noxium]|uniref:Uncharacterized protein n=1 Tax=Pyrrhoderma noxium TaxID=2282107 RepID=A0A286UK96_9AGAM|nr:hypothetical protein PNOK_0496100 [Pyrrhoderma noxium]